MSRRRAGGIMIIGVALGIVAVLAVGGLSRPASAHGQENPAGRRTSQEKGRSDPGGEPAAREQAPGDARRVGEPGRDNGSRKVTTLAIRRTRVEWKTVQEFSVRPFEVANLYANVSGYLAKQTVDLGDHVAKGQFLAEVNAPELMTAVGRAEADLALAEAQANQAQARIGSAEAERKAAEAAIQQAEAEAQKRAAERKYREKQYNRIAELARRNAVEVRLVDEEENRRDSAVSADLAGKAAEAVARAKAEAGRAGVDQARADHSAALAAVRVANEKLAEARILAANTRILAPYDGIVTGRNYHLGDFIRSAATGGNSLPILTVASTDKMRIVIQVPGAYLPLLNAGDRAVIEVAGLGVPIHGEVARTAEVVDPTTNTTRAEIDLPTPGGRIRPGMTGKATIVLEPPHEAIVIPVSALVIEDGVAFCFRVEAGRAVRARITVGLAALQQAEIRDGLKEGDVVALGAEGLRDGQPIEVAPGDDEATTPRQ